MKVAGIVLKWIRGEKALNFKRFEAMARQAAVGGADIVCSTECFLDGYAIKDKTIPEDQYYAMGEKIPAVLITRSSPAWLENSVFSLPPAFMKWMGRPNTTPQFSSTARAR